MNEENENLVLEDNESTENTAEQAAENFVDGEQTDQSETIDSADETNVEDEKLYSEKELNEKLDKILTKKISRAERNAERKYKEKIEKYAELEEVLKFGTQKDSIEDITETYKKFYESKGYKPSQNKSELSDADIEILANAEANRIIDNDEVEDELKILTEKGFENMTTREKKVFKILSDNKEKSKFMSELASIGAKSEILNDNDFKTLAEKFAGSKFTAKEIYDIYTKQSVNNNPQDNVEQIGSQKSNYSKQDKEWFTSEEIDRLTPEDYRKNPSLLEKVRKSILRG